MGSDNSRGTRRTILALLLLASAGAAYPGPLRERLARRRDLNADEQEDDTYDAQASAADLLRGIELRPDIAYGPADEQRLDLYLPRNRSSRSAMPTIFMVHGGGWYRGDKAARSVVQNKVTHWVGQEYAFISANYRMLPKAGPLEQADDLARALAFAQQQAPGWGGDPNGFILMGHSAGAHLSALLAAAPEAARRHGANPWRGTVLLDSAALDVVAMMEGRHAPLYDRAFGQDPSYWRSASPYHQLHSGASPFLAVCSAKREVSIAQARRFAAKAASLDVRVQVLEQDLSHRDINVELGKPGPYTRAVDAFIASLTRE